MKEISISTEYIKLDQFLKLAGIAQTGGHAKLMISEGQVMVNDNIAYERGKKIRKNDIIKVQEYDSFIII